VRTDGKGEDSLTKLLGLLAVIFGLIVAVAASADLVKLVGAVVVLFGLLVAWKGERG
jgi:hypothetical protein